MCVFFVIGELGTLSLSLALSLLAAPTHAHTHSHHRITLWWNFSLIKSSQTKTVFPSFLLPHLEGAQRESNFFSQHPFKHSVVWPPRPE